MSKITALLEARNQISPELVKVQREVQKSRQAMGGLDDETRKALQGIGRMADASEKMSRDMVRDLERAQREIHDLRSELNRLGSMNEKPRVEVDNQATQEITDIRQQLLALGGIAAAITIGSNVGNMMSEAEAAFRERALYSVKGKTEQEMQTFDQKTKELLLNNPYMNRAEAMATISKSEKYNGKNAGAYAEAATKLGVTTRYAPEEHLKMMAVLRENTGVDDAKRLGNSLQYMANNLKDFKEEFVDSIIEYSVQTSKFLDTPEKMAALVGQIGKMGIWSDDKAFDSLKETTLKLTNQGDLTNVLKTGYETQGMKAEKALELATKEAAEINKLIHSENRADNQAAMGRMMLTLATIQDKNVRQQILNELGAGPGEDLGRHFAPLLEYAGKLATGQIRPEIGDEMNRAYKLATENNPLFEYQKAQNEAKQAVMDFGSKVAQDATPALAFLSEKATALANVFNNMSDTTRYGIEIAAASAAIIGGGLLLIKSATAHLRAARALEAAAKSMGGDGGPDIGGKKKWWNPKMWKKDVPDVPARKWMSSADAKRALDGLAPVEETVKKGLLGGMKDRITGMLPTRESLKTFGGSAIKKLPYLGALIGAGQILTAEDKAEAAGKVGSEAAGGLGGAAAGAALGSIIPGIGTAVGAAVGGVLGAWGGGAIFDKAKDWWGRQPAEKPPVPVASTPVVANKPPTVTMNPEIKIELRADGVLQDVPSMLKMLDSPLVQNKITNDVQKAFIRAIDTSGGVPTRMGGVPK
ncbi:MAG TPA: hypothetical protein VEZ13_20485 [Brevibacillus sp.]|nr:hypothetical protein [Brevibacillus sp.]